MYNIIEICAQLILESTVYYVIPIEIHAKLMLEQQEYYV